MCETYLLCILAQEAHLHPPSSFSLMWYSAVIWVNQAVYILVKNKPLSSRSGKRGEKGRRLNQTRILIKQVYSFKLFSCLNYSFWKEIILTQADFVLEKNDEYRSQSVMVDCQIELIHFPNEKWHDLFSNSAQIFWEVENLLCTFGSENFIKLWHDGAIFFKFISINVKCCMLTK